MCVCVLCSCAVWMQDWDRLEQNIETPASLTGCLQGSEWNISIRKLTLRAVFVCFKIGQNAWHVSSEGRHSAGVLWNLHCWQQYPQHTLSLLCVFYYVTKNISNEKKIEFCYDYITWFTVRLIQFTVVILYNDFHKDSQWHKMNTLF